MLGKLTGIAGLLVRGVKGRAGLDQAGIDRLKAARLVQRRFHHHARDAMQILLGVLSAGLGLRGFLIPNGFIDGGVMGISLLTNRETGVALSLLILFINIPFLLLGYRRSPRPRGW